MSKVFTSYFGDPAGLKYPIARTLFRDDFQEIKWAVHAPGAEAIETFNPELHSHRTLTAYTRVALKPEVVEELRLLGGRVLRELFTERDEVEKGKSVFLCGPVEVQFRGCRDKESKFARVQANIGDIESRIQDEGDGLINATIHKLNGLLQKWCQIAREEYLTANVTHFTSDHTFEKAYAFEGKVCIPLRQAEAKAQALAEELAMARREVQQEKVRLALSEWKQAQDPRETPAELVKCVVAQLESGDAFSPATRGSVFHIPPAALKFDSPSLEAEAVEEEFSAGPRR